MKKLATYLSTALKGMSIGCFALAIILITETVCPSGADIISDAEFRRNITIATWLVIGGIIL